MLTRLFPLPLVSFIRIIRNNGGLSLKGFRNAFRWFPLLVLCEPLRWIELVRWNKRIKKYTIEQSPIFILGYYRSGTTYLQELFSKDNRLGSMSLFQTILPMVMLSHEKWLTPVLEGLTRLARKKNIFHRLPLSWYTTGEEDIALATSTNPCSPQWGYFFPEKILEYYARSVVSNKTPDIENWKENYQLLLKKISLANHGKLLVLKNPPNTARIKLLLEMFPDARFIHIHRNPYELYPSNRKMLGDIIKKYSLGSIKQADQHRIVIEMYKMMMNKYIKERELIPEGRLIEVEYRDLVAAPIKVMESLYRSLNLSDFQYCKPRMQAFADTRRTFKPLEHTLSTVQINTITFEWGDIIKELGYPLEHSLEHILTN